MDSSAAVHPNLRGLSCPLCPAGSDEEMADADAAAAPEEAGRTVGSGRQAAQGKKVYRDQKGFKAGAAKTRSWLSCAA